VYNRGGPIKAGKSFAVAAFVRPLGESGDEHAWRVNFGTPPTEPGVMPVITLTIAGPMKPQSDKTLLTTAWARVPASERQSPLEVVAIVDSCGAGPPCAVVEQNEKNNERAIQVSWP
jgi:hypothetical protein